MSASKTDSKRNGTSHSNNKTLNGQVYDKDTLSDDFLGGKKLNLNMLALREKALTPPENEPPLSFEMLSRKGG